MRLRESEQRLALAQRAGHVGVFDWNLTNNHLFVTAETEEIFGMPSRRGHYDFNEFLRLVHPEDSPGLQANFAATFAAHKPQISHDFRIIRPDGAVRQLSHSAFVSYDADGRPLQMVGTSLDLTEHKLAEQALRASEEKFSRIFELCPDAIALSRVSDGVYLDINSGFEHNTGWTRADIVGRSSFSPDLNLWAHNADRERLVAQIRQFGEATDLEAEFRCKDGSIVTGLMSARVIPIDGVPCILSITRNITERKRIETLLRESEQRLTLAQRAGHVGVFDWNVASNRLFATPETEAIYGNPPTQGDYSWDKFLARLHPDDRDRVKTELFQNFAARLSESETHFRIIRPDGSVRFLYNRALITYDPDGRPLRMIGTCLDITDQKLAEQALRASEEKFSRIFHLCPDAISLTRIDNGVFIDVNSGFERGTGWTRDELIGRSSRTTGAGNWVRDADRQRLIDIVRHHGEIVDFETQFRTKDGSVTDGLISARIIDIEGVPCLLSITRDITQRKRTEAQLEQQNSLMNALINSTEDPIFSVDRNHCYTLFNASHARIIKTFFGKDLRLGDSSIDYLPTPEARRITQSNLERAMKGERVEFDFPGPNEHDERRDFFVTINPVRNPNGDVTGAAVFGHDLTDQRRLQSQLLQAQKMEAIGLLAGGIAHDFRNQLTVISAAGDLLRDDPNLPPHLRVLVDQILDAAHQSSNMTSKLLSFSRKQMLQPKLVDVAELAAESANILPRLLRHDIRLEFSAQSRPLMALLDPIQFQQAIFNLATNARDAMPNGGTLRLTCRRFHPDADFRQRHPGAANNYIAVDVSDNGQGMDQQTLSHIFEPFFTTKPVGRGTGLGLAMVYGFVSQCAGIVDVQSAPGSGATFTLLFREAANHHPTPTTPARTETPAPAGSQRILVVEDDAAIRHLLLRFLSAAGYQPVECPTAPDALARLQNTAEAFDLLLSDIVMPDLSGTDLARQARQLRPSLPILLISGFSRFQPENTLSGIAAHFLAKPFARKDLLHAVRTALHPPVPS